MKKTEIRSSGVAATKKARVALAAHSKTGPFFGVAKPMATPRVPAVKEFCQAYGLAQDTFTRLAGFSPRAVAHWAQGRKPSESSQRRLIELNRVFTALQQLVAKDAIGPWLKQPNPAFDGSTPLQVLERGEMDRIWRMIYQLQSGEP